MPTDIYKCFLVEILFLSFILKSFTCCLNTKSCSWLYHCSTWRQFSAFFKFCQILIELGSVLRIWYFSNIIIKKWFKFLLLHCFCKCFKFVWWNIHFLSLHKRVVNTLWSIGIFFLSWINTNPIEVFWSIRVYHILDYSNYLKYWRLYW
jgi:hypothetical protein